eukprot:425674_1
MEINSILSNIKNNNQISNSDECKSPSPTPVSSKQRYNVNNNQNNYYGVITETNDEINNLIMHQYTKLFEQHKLLCNTLIKYLRSCDGTWTDDFMYYIVHELLFNTLIQAFEKINKLEQSTSLMFCEQLSINKQQLFEIFYQTSNYKLFLSSSNKIFDIQKDIFDILFIEHFISKLNLDSDETLDKIHERYKAFVRQCVEISWQITTQCAASLQFTPNTFDVELNKIEYDQKSHNISYRNSNENDCAFVLYYIWPHITDTNFHSICAHMKIEICIGSSVPQKININQNNALIRDDRKRLRTKTTVITSFCNIEGRLPKCKLFISFYAKYLTMKIQSQCNENSKKTIIYYSDILRIISVPDRNDNILLVAQLNKKISLNLNKTNID